LFVGFPSLFVQCALFITHVTKYALLFAVLLQLLCKQQVTSPIEEEEQLEVEQEQEQQQQQQHPFDSSLSPIPAGKAEAATDSGKYQNCFN